MRNMIRSLWSTRVFAIYPTIESLASSYTVNDDLRRETDTGYREVVPGDDKTRRSIARVSLFRDRFWRSSEEQEDNVVRSDFFGERMSSGDISWRAIRHKVVRYLANEGERNKFRATTRRPASVIGCRTKIIPGI
ncbi:unnamed protein product [Lasius platythorax]|uniref:Uncharacterized protein n=1 Tax=Lasius platythorax TaxID=488582 RepID=A0AAV2N6S2_9HYME